MNINSSQNVSANNLIDPENRNDQSWGQNRVDNHEEVMQGMMIEAGTQKIEKKTVKR